MTEERAKRKLSAILSADVKGYSRLMQDDESSTVQTLKAYRELMTSLTHEYRGRVVDSPGDNVLAEFGSVVDAVECAVKIQQELEEKNAGLPENRMMEFRIGVNLGDVIEDEDRIYGDGVNIAARVEGVAEGGGICISGSAYEQVRNKLTVGYKYLGDHTVKNIAQPVKVYRILLEPEYAGKLIGEEKPKPKRWVWAMTAAAVVVLITCGVTIWQFYFRLPSVEAASVENMAFPLPDKPSIAVLAFDNMSGDHEQEYIADGISENIITTLSKVPNLFVIARNTSFTYKGKPVKIQQVSEELGVRYVLEGSVQKSGERIRITAQLIDAIKGNHIWAEKYDRKFKDIFALQDDIALSILKELHLELTGLGGGYKKGTDNPEAYLKLIKGLYYMYRVNKEDNTFAREQFEEAIALDPNYAAAVVGVGYTYYNDAWAWQVKGSIKKAEEMAQKTLALDDSFSGGHTLMTLVYRERGQFDKALAEGKRAIELDPNGADTILFQGDTLRMASRPKEALILLEKAMRLNPKPPAIYYWPLGSVYHMLGRYEEAIAAYEPIFSHKLRLVSFLGHVGLTFAYLELGRVAEARSHAAEVLKIRPDAPFVTWAAAILRYKDMEHLKRLVKPLDSLLYGDAGKREVYVNKGPPFFKFEYPGRSVKQALNPNFTQTVIILKASVPRLIRASVMDLPENMTLADTGPEYYLEWLKNSGTGSNAKIISNKPITLKDGTKAYRTEFEYFSYTGAFKVGSIAVSAFRDKKLVQLDIHAIAGVQSEAAWIVESLTFK